MKSYRTELRTQLVTCEEFDFYTAFSPGQIETTKLMFEGEGCSFRKGPYKDFVDRYNGAVCVIASNIIPDQEAKCHTEEFRKNVWEPISRRADILILDKEIPKEMEEPYTVNQLAYALQYLTEVNN